VYDAGGFYTAHRDNALGPDETILDMGLLGWLRSAATRRRAVTAILYLNSPDWDLGRDGGALRLYPHAENTCRGGLADPQLNHDKSNADDANSGLMVGAGSPVDVAPAGGTLVVFDSRNLLHQVRPVTGGQQRFALTAWIFGAQENFYGGAIVDDDADAIAADEQRRVVAVHIGSTSAIGIANTYPCRLI
jgi:hypothetical protein